MSDYAANLEDIRDASQRLGTDVHRTPILKSSTMNRLAQKTLYFKCENLQRVGAFKMRGALNALRSLSDSDRKRGVVTHSSGNFAQAVALSARICGVPAHIVMPENAPAVKRRAVEDYGAHVVSCVPTLAAREEAAARLVEQTGGALLHPFDQDEVIAGQGTVALELNEQISDFDAVIVPVGGGGLISGIALALRELRPQVRIFGAEPQGADDAARSKKAGKWILQESPNTIADGLLTSLGERTWPVIRDCVEEVLVVDDTQILHAMRLIWERMKIVVEPSAAIVLAAALSDDFQAKEGLDKTVLVLSGGNVDLEKRYW